LAKHDLNMMMIIMVAVVMMALNTNQSLDSIGTGSENRGNEYRWMLDFDVWMEA